MILSEIGKIVEQEWIKTPEFRADMNLELDAKRRAAIHRSTMHRDIICIPFPATNPFLFGMNHIPSTL